MHTALVDRTIAELRAIRRYTVFSGKIRSLHTEMLVQSTKCTDFTELFKEAPDATSWRVIDHCTAITRTYALFEAFVLQVLREYIGFLARSYSFSQLGTDFAIKYTRGIGQILIDQEKARYTKIDVGSLLSEVTAAITNQSPYQIQPEALLQTEQNLRMAELQRLFAHCGLRGINEWISKHRSIRSFFATQSRLSETADSELKQIVDYRNEASHGEVDQVLGQEILIEVTEFFEALLTSIAEFVQYDILTRAKEVGSAKLIGVISERFHDDIVVAKIANSSLSVGDTMYVYGKGISGVARIKSIQLDNVGHETADITAEREVGLALGLRAKVGCELLRLS